MEKRRNKEIVQSPSGLPRQLGAMLAAVRTRMRAQARTGLESALRPAELAGIGATSGADAGPVSLHRASLVPRERQWPRPAAWSLDAVRSLEWKRFGQLCARYYEAAGFRTDPLEAGTEATPAFRLLKTDPSQPLAVVQCRGFATSAVGVEEVRALLHAMAQANVARGILVTSGTFTADAVAFGAAHPLQLLDGAAFEGKLRALAADKQDELRVFAFEGDYRTPTCPSCGIKMRAREGKRWQFWGCKHYPKCKSMFTMQK